MLQTERWTIPARLRHEWIFRKFLLTGGMQRDPEIQIFFARHFFRSIQIKSTLLRLVHKRKRETKGSSGAIEKEVGGRLNHSKTALQRELHIKARMTLWMYWIVYYPFISWMWKLETLTGPIMLPTLLRPGLSPMLSIPNLDLTSRYAYTRTREVPISRKKLPLVELLSKWKATNKETTI